MSSGDEHKIRWMARIDQLLNSVEQASSLSHAQSATREAVQLLLEAHKAGIAKLVQSIHQSGESKEILSDELVNSLLLVHDLHPHSLHRRVENAVGQIRPYLHEHGGEAEILSIAEGVVRLQHHLGSAGATNLTRTFGNILRESILASAPEIARVEIVESCESGGAPIAVLVPLPLVSQQ